MSRPLIHLGLLALLALSACDRLGLEDPAKAAATREAEGKAIGSACRQSGRAIEDCFEMNPKAQKAAIFAGWREMDGYMRENKMEAAKPSPVDSGAAAKTEAAPAADPAKAKPGKAAKAEK